MATIETLDDIDWDLVVLEPDQHAVCPVCEERIPCGKSGVMNMRANHTLSDKCKNKRDQKIKEKADTRKKYKDGSLLSFVRRKPTVIPPTVSPAPLVKGSHIQYTVNYNTPVHPKLASNKEGTDLRQCVGLIERLKYATRDLPQSVPEATDIDILAAFAGIPPSCDDPTIDSTDLWEVVLNPFLKQVLGWGAEADMHQVVRRGENGLGGVLEFVRYFVERRGVDVALFEGKLGRLVESAEELIAASVTRGDITEDIEAALTEPEAVADGDVVMVDLLSHLDLELAIPSNLQAIEARVCRGYHLEFPNGTSPYTDYPSALHNILPLAWNYEIRGGVMTLHAFGCPADDFGLGNHQSCVLCRRLSQNRSLQGIKSRLAEGVHENARWEYHGVGGLVTLLQRKNEKIEFYRLRSLNQVRVLLGKAAALSEYKRFVAAIATGNVASVDRVIRIGLAQKRGIRGLGEMWVAAAKGIYHPRGYTEEADMQGLLLWKLGGNRIAHINHRARGDPSLTYLRNRSFTPPLVPSHGQPTTEQVSQNVRAVFVEDVVNVMHERTQIVHAVVMFDELATEKRIRWDHHTNYFLGVCREHGHKTSLEFEGMGDLEQLFSSLDVGEVHYAAEATVAAIGVLCDNHRIYPARGVLVSGDCKRESGKDHAKVVQTVIDGINNEKNTTKIRIVSLASDGESRRGLAFSHLTLKYKLSPDSPIFPLLSPLVFMNRLVGIDDLTCDKDFKHIVKRFRNFIIRPRGVVINGYRIPPDLLQNHLKSNGASTDHVRRLFKPDDAQDVPTAFELLQDIWTLPSTVQTTRPGVQDARDAIWVLGKLVLHLVFPYLCVELSLSEQLEHLSAAAHLTLVLYRLDAKSFLPTELFIDVMLMIKNIYFCVAKAKIDDPCGSFWIVLLGTDRLEELFGILRTMVGNDVNLDILQLVSRLSGTTEVANILARYPHWDRPPRRLKLPALSRKALSRDSKALPAAVDHIKPGSWKGDVCVANVSLQSAWKRGRSIVETECSFTIPILSSLQANREVDILSPFGTLLPSSPGLVNSIDESLDDTTLVAREPSNTHENQSSIVAETDNRLEVETSLSEAAVEDAPPSQSETITRPLSRYLKVDEKSVNKSRLLAQYGRYRKSSTSTDRLRRVQEVGRYVSQHPLVAKLHGELSISTDDPVLAISDPIASLLHCDDHAWLVIGEVNSLKVDGDAVDFIPHSLLPESTITISYQVLGLRPTTSDDNIDSQLNDWRSCKLGTEHTYTVSGLLVQPINPDIPMHLDFKSPRYYLFDSRNLVALSASLYERLATTTLKTIPKIMAEQDFPYRERSGKSCFICDDNGIMESLGKGNFIECPVCGATLDIAQGQRVLEHMGAHILFDTAPKQIPDRCGLCLRPSTLCHYFLMKGKGAKRGPKIDSERSHGCILSRCNFAYAVAAKSSKGSPCSNVPLDCPRCAKRSQAVWRYNLKEHFQVVHPTLPIGEYEHLYTLSKSESEGMKTVYGQLKKSMVKEPRKQNTAPLVVSDAHRASMQVPFGAESLGSLADGHSNAISEEEDNLLDIQDINQATTSIDDSSNATGTSRHDNPPAPISGGENQSFLDGEGLSRVSVETSDRTARKRTAFSHESLSTCMCGQRVDLALATDLDVIECHRPGCETRYYHIVCIKPTKHGKNWICEACEASREGKRGRR